MFPLGPIILRTFFNIESKHSISYPLLSVKKVPSISILISYIFPSLNSDSLCYEIEIQIDLGDFEIKWHI